MGSEVPRSKYGLVYRLSCWIGGIFILFTPIVGKIFRQVSEKYFANRRKMFVKSLIKMKAPSFLMVLTGIGDFAYRRQDGVYVVPIGCLKN